MCNTTLVITDLDGTLGNSNEEIARALVILAQSARRAALCIVTGRSLNSLRPLMDVIRPGTLVSPWGGGNVFSFTGRDFVSVTPRSVIPIEHGPEAPNYIAVPRKVRIRAKDEIHLDLGEWKHEADVVAAYWSFDADDGDAAIRVANARGLTVSHGRNALWVNLGPVPAPRLYTMRQCRARVQATHVVYLGDSRSDEECVEEADLFFAPCDSALAKTPGVTVFADIEMLMRDHLTSL